jgi:L-2-hydroxyglutarate oxidase
MAGQRYDVVVVGAGIVGLATAMEMLKRRPNLKLAVIDKETDVSKHQTGHNSGVIHSGIYYAPGSLKATLCVQGVKQLVRFCDERDIPYDLCGKVIVATQEKELPGLQKLYERGVANGVPGVEIIGPERLRELEPHVRGIKAIYSPKTGIVDYVKVAGAYADEVRGMGGDILLGREVTNVDRRAGAVTVETTGGEVQGDYLISCAGLFADRIARMTGAPRAPQIVPFRGDYYELVPAKRHLINNLIYPVPDPEFPFLGVHFTRHINGDRSLGPNAVLAFAREGYKKLDIKPKELGEALSYGGFQKMAVMYWKMGLGEYWRDFNKQAFVKALQAYVPEIQPEDCHPGPAGVRAQAIQANGKMVDDFVFATGDRVMHVRNAPSPAATASIAIGGEIVNKAEGLFDLAPARQPAAV